MNEFKKLLSLEEEKIDWKIVLFLILISYTFNILVRYIYISIIGDNPQFLWQHHLMINNNDGYYWAEGARDIIAGFHQKNDLSPVNTLPSILTAYLSKTLSFISFDQLIEFLPGFFGSLVVVPVFMIGRLLGSTWLGFLASLMSGMVWSYYHRTMFGYYDTDMLVITLPTFAIWLTMLSLKNKNFKLFLLAPLVEIFMIQWHGGLFNVANGIFIMSFLYISLFDRQKNSILFLIFLMLPVLPVAVAYKLILLLICYMGLLLIKTKDNKINPLFFLIAILLLYILAVGFPWIKSTLISGYITRDVTNDENGLHFFSVVNTVREAGHISYDTLVHRISGSWFGIIFGVIGYALLLIRYPLLMISLPMVALGFFAIRGGLRFTIFAVPFMALGDAYIAYLFAKTLKKIFADKKMASIAKYLISFLIMAAFIYPNYKHIYKYLVPTVFTKNDVAVLNKLKHIASRDDYVLSWWDYGYPIRYYADVKTLIDGGKHTGDVNFPVSFALTRNLKASRNMAILDVYQTEYDYNHDINNSNYLKEMMKRYDTKDPNDFLSMLSTDIKLPKIKEDIYYFLPLKMFNIFPTISMFSAIDLNTGQEIKHFFIQLRAVRKSAQTVIFNNGMKLFLNKGAIEVGRNVYPVSRFAVVGYDKRGILHKKVQKVRDDGLNVIYLESYGRWLIMDNFYYNSTFVQLFIFENTGGLFEPVILTPFAKIYKVIK